MPLGRVALRNLKAMSPIVLLALVLFGCSALPQSTRVIPRTAEIQTRLQPHRDPTPEAKSTLGSTETPGDPKRFLDALDEVSPLPPAIPKPSPPTELPPSLPAVTMAVPSPKPEPEPPLDEATKRADVPDIALVEETTRPAGAEVVVKPEPKVDALTAPEVTPTTGPAPIPTPTPTPATPQPAPAPEPKAAVSTPLKPEEIWREGVEVLRSVAKDRLKDVNKESKPGSPNWVVRERLLGWLADPEVDSHRGTSLDLAQERALLKGLAVVLDPSTPPEIRGAEIRDVIATLEAQAPLLEITELKLCRIVHGFGNIEPLEPASRKAGQSVILYCELSGLAYESVGPGFRSRVAAEVELIPEGAESSRWSHSLGTAEDTCRRRRRDFFIGHKFTLPESLAVGNYRLRLTEKDLVSNRSATSETSITITR